MQNYCEICKLPAHGSHFGAFTCRACAAFFRRAILAKRIRKSCKLNNNCSDFRGLKTPPCKSCRMRKCVQAGMISDSKKNSKKKFFKLFSDLQIQKIDKNIPQSVEICLGRPNILLLSKSERTFVDLNYLIKQGLEILNFGSPSPLNPGKSQLEKMTLAISKPSRTCKKLSFANRDHATQIWETDFLSAAKFFTHFDSFMELPPGMQMQLLQAIWHIWSRVLKVANTAKLCNGKWDKNQRVFHVHDDFYVDLDDTEFDVSWMVSCSFEQVKYFLFGENLNAKIEEGVNAIHKLNLSEIELSFMMAQLCFEYAENRFSGTEIAGICERFQEVLADDIHKYYTRESWKDKNYAGRLAQILKINREIQRTIRQLRDKTHVARTLDILTVDFSHPEMFIDSGCK
ncbi:hypothetical protein L3Y34_007235 [Caenorhabditis briggsae]|uniref:Nuclear Hormone Receptor family n=1 Tax=Caenorhabditis briggsae TaxID=6238 RepID=A0AAE9A3H7_CAEBR|nr:hypothetical protein L3Y34_007235 [Caenorhabditis briggsae]